MNEPEKEKWKALDARLKLHLTPAQYKACGLAENDPDVNEVISGYDYRTFPKDHHWLDQKGNTWRRVGLNVFDFKLQRIPRTMSRLSIKPDGDLRLQIAIKGLTLTLFCSVDAARLNDRDEIDEDAVAIQNEERHLTTICGRATLMIRSFEVLPHARPRAQPHAAHQPRAQPALKRKRDSPPS